MAKIIEFYIPQSFRKVSKWFPQPDVARCWHFHRRHENRRDRSLNAHGEARLAGLDRSG